MTIQLTPENTLDYLSDLIDQLEAARLTHAYKADALAESEYNLIVTQAQVETATVEAAGESGLGKNKEERDRALILALFNSGVYQAARLTCSRAKKAEIEAKAHAEALVERIKSARAFIVQLNADQ